IKENLKVDILFCDQEMPDFNGLKAQDILNGHFHYFVLVTHYDRYAMSAYNHGVDGYLLKPLREEYTLRLLKKISLSHLDAQEDFVVYFKADENEHKALDMAQVPCILSDGNYCHVYTPKAKKTKWIVSTSLKSMELQI